MKVISFEQANTTELEMLAKAIGIYNKPINDYQVVVGFIKCFAVDPDNEDDYQPSLKKNGIPVIALTKPVSTKDRIIKKYDVEIVVDGNRWNELNDDLRLAVLDHEVSSIIVMLDKEGNVSRDTSERPKVKIKKDNLMFSGSSDTLARHGENSQEFIKFNELSARINHIMKS